MNKFSEMSDFEINRLVAKIATDGDVISKEDMWPCDNGNAVQIIYKVGVSGEFKDYCNSWSDMGPLIENCGICICPDLSKPSDWVADKSVEFYSRIERIANTRNENPLRAAAEVYLMIKDGE